MALKDIFVHLDNTRRCEVRLEMAAALAARNGACLVGLFAQSDPNVPGIIPEWPTPYFKQAAEESEAAFQAQAKAAGVRAQWHMVPSGEHGYLMSKVVQAASHSDLAVMGQHDPEHGKGVLPAELVEQVILNAGRPTLVVPFAGRFHSVGERVLVAWNGGREAARALNDALPMMVQAKQSRIVSINPRDGERGEEDIVRHLSCHGVTAEVEKLVAEDIGVMDLLLSRVADTDADLLVMGAHGNYGFPSLKRGAGTRHILRHMTVPVMMSH